MPTPGGPEMDESSPGDTEAKRIPANVRTGTSGRIPEKNPGGGGDQVFLTAGVKRRGYHLVVFLVLILR